jgi:DNA/RNA-binding domain of Phe-tRNA-synthetase-like protein
MNYAIEPNVFGVFPTFRRGVLLANHVDNMGFEPELARLLSNTATNLNHALSDLEHERIEVWNEAYRKLGNNPSKFTPSIRFLRERISRGKAPKPISKLVDIFNIVSLRWTAPCGGDDLDALAGGDLRLGFAHGDETFAPLFKPEAVEHPVPGEVIYYTVPSRRVLCRRWTWRNSDFSKIRAETRAVAINVDMMTPPFYETDLHSALADLGSLVLKFCGGSISTYVVDQSNPEFEI